MYISVLGVYIQPLDWLAKYRKYIIRKKRCSGGNSKVCYSMLLTLSMKFIWLVRQDLSIFSLELRSHMWKYKKSCLTHEKKIHIQRQTIEYPL